MAKSTSRVAAHSLEALLRIGRNQDVFRLLAEQLASPLGVVPFVGAGLSIPSGMPGWANFLREQAGTIGPECRMAVDAHIRCGEFEEAAEYLAAQQGHSWFQDTLVSSFGPHLLENREPSGAITLLPRLVRGPVITTNLDHVIEKVFERTPFDEKAWGARAGLVGAALHSERRYLLKLHGDVLDASDRVLTLSDYEHHYGSKRADAIDLSLALPDVLKTAFTARTLLFLGCSLTVDRTVRLLKRVITPSSPTHYAILEQPSDNEAPLERARFLSEHKIRPLWFPEGEFEALEIFIQALAARVQSLSRTASRRSEFVKLLLMIPALLGALIFAGPWLQRVLSAWQVLPWMQTVSLFLVVLSLAGIVMHRRWQQGPGIPLKRLKLSPSIANGVFGGLLGGTIASIAVAYTYYNLPGVDPSLTPAPAIILYCVTSSVVLGAAIQLMIIACMRARAAALTPSVIGNEITGGIMGGAIAGVLCGAAGGWYFGQLPQPSVTPAIVMIGAMIGAITIVGGYLFFNYVGSFRRAARVLIVASIVAGLCGMIGVLGLGYLNPDGLFTTAVPAEALAFDGAQVGGVAGALMGLHVGLTLLLYRRWDEWGIR